MKTLITISLLLALVVPAHAAKAKPRDWSLISDWQAAFWLCRRVPDDKACAEADKLEKKLTARGYCTYARGAVGRAGQRYFYPGIDSAGTNSHWTRHCYEIDNLPAD
jgi:hypothetical protein